MYSRTITYQRELPFEVDHQLHTNSVTANSINSGTHFSHSFIRSFIYLFCRTAPVRKRQLANWDERCQTKSAEKVLVYILNKEAGSVDQLVERLPRIHEVMGSVSRNLALHEPGGVGRASLQIKHLGDKSGGRAGWSEAQHYP